MAKIAIALMMAMFASVALAQTTCGTTSLFSRPANCAGYTTCETALCTCGQVTGTNADVCLANVSSTFPCTSLTACFSTFAQCLSTLANTARLNTTEPCGMWAVSLHTAVLSAAGGSFAGSTLQSACATAACNLRNKTSTTTLRSCDMGGANFTTVCSVNNIVLPGTTTAAGPTTTRGATSSPSGASTVSMAVIAVLAVVAALL